MSILKKIALLLPSVRNVKTDLENRRNRAAEFELENTLLVKKNEDLHEDISFMKKQMARAIPLKEAETQLVAKADHFQGQLEILKAKNEMLKTEVENLENQNCLLRLANDDLTLKNAEFSQTAV